MRFVNPIIFVKDMGRSVAFYRDVVGLAVVADHGDFVLMEHHFGIHEVSSIRETVWDDDGPIGDGPIGHRDLLLYFEDDDVDGCFERIRGRVRLIHPLLLQQWGQRVFRFYDPDDHAVEIGEPMK